MKCAIIDDEPLALGLLESYVKKTPMLELCGTYSSAVEAMGGLQQHPADLIFLDIQMPDLNGLDFSKTIDTSRTRIIFTTAFSQYAIDGYKVNALDYLLKPISYADFVGAVNRAQKWYDLAQTKQKTLDNAAPVPITSEAQEVNTSSLHLSATFSATQGDGYMFVKSDYKLLRVDFSEILYIEGLKDYVKIYTSSAAKPILSLTSMRSIETALPSSQFMRTHRSYIVNMQKVRVLERGQIVFGEKYIPISDSYKEQVMGYLNSHLLQGR
uniref:LytR/AlgR family response regulator transcription factor n=1 Tax=Alloprevotella sp. TaxID=1872471 RepID=UPI0040283E6A